MTGKSTTDKASALRRLGCSGLLLAFACLVGSAAKAQGPAPTLITAPAVYPGAINTIPNAVAMGDFNGDGLIDFAVVEYPNTVPGNGQVQIFLGNPDGSFTAGGIYTIGNIAGQPYATNHNIAVGHFNGPLQPVGIAVAVTQAPGCPSGGVVLLYGPGDGTFPNTGCLVNSPGVISVAVADYNNDTYDDIAVSNASGAAAGSITVYFNNGTINTGPPPNSFYKYGNFSSVLLSGVGGSTVYGTLVAGNLPSPGSNGPSLAMLSNGGPFTQYVSIFENILAGPNGNPVAVDFYASYQPLTISGNGLTDIAWTNLPVQGPTSLVGIGSVGSAGGLQAIPITYPVGIGPALGPLTPVANNLPGIAMVAADFDGNGTPDFAYLDSNQNLNISLNPGTTTSSNIGPFGPKGQAVAAERSPGLGGKWVVVDAGIDQPLNPLLTPYNAARSVAVYLVDPTTGKPEIAPLYAPPSGFNSVANGGQSAFAVADFNGVGVPDVAVLGQDEVNFDATVSIFQNAYKTATPPGYATPPTVIDLGTLGASYGAANGYALVAGSFRAFDPDIALVTSQGITLLENQGANTQGPFNFTLAPNCQGYFGGPATPPNNCYLGNDPNYPGISFLSNSPRPAIIAADVNGDGPQDVVVAYPENCNANSNPNSAIYVFLSNGDGTFQTPIYILSPVVNPVGLAAGKLLGSAFPDLVVVDGGEICSGTQAVTGSQTLVGVALIPNIGGALSGPAAKNLFPQPSGKISPNISAVAVADMNADGAPDVVISASDGLHVLLNNPLSPGAFTDQGAVPLYGSPDIISNAAEIDIADLNKDGTLDVAAAIGGIVYIFPGDGKGGLSTPVQAFASGPDSNQVRAIDVNGDGTADVVVNNSQGFSVLLNGSTIGSGNPIAQYLQTPLNFIPLAQGSTDSIPFILANSGGGPLTLGSVAYASNTGNEFSTPQVQCGSASNPGYPLTIAPGTACTFTITFAPTTVGPASAQLIFSDNASLSNVTSVPASVGNFQQSISLTGTGTAGQANVSINITTSPAPVALGTQDLIYTITLTNNGPDAATNLNFSHQLEPSVMLQNLSSSMGACLGQHALGVLVTCNLGTLPAGSVATMILDVTPTVATTLTNPFAITEDETDSNPESVQANVAVLSSLTVPIPTIMENISVSDAPSFTEIPVSENLIVSDQVTVTPLIGVVGVPAATFSDSSLGFNSSTGTAQNLTVSNVGNAPLAFFGSFSISSGFSVGPILCSDGTTSMPTSLAIGGQCTFAIIYAGTAPTGTITFTDNAALSSPASTQSGSNYVQTIQLNGAAGSSVVIGPPSATVTIPTISEPITVTDTFVPPVASVPNVVGLTQAAASTALTNAGLTIGTVTTAASTTVAAGNVISQSLGVGTTVSLGTAVNLVVSSGAPFVRISPSSSNPVRVAAGSSTYIVAVTLTNGGNVSIGTLTLVKASLGGLGALTFPSSTTLSNIAPGTSATFTATFSSAAGAPGKSVPVSFTGTYTAGSLNGNWTTSFRSSGPLP